MGKSSSGSSGSNGTRPAAARPYFRLDTTWWLVTTAGMSPQQRGAFDSLMIAAWMQDPPGSLPDDDEQLAAIAGYSPSAWSPIAPLVKSKFRRARGRLFLDQLVDQYTAMCADHAANVAAGRKGARRRWGGHK